MILSTRKPAMYWPRKAGKSGRGWPENWLRPEILISLFVLNIRREWKRILSAKI